MDRELLRQALTKFFAGLVLTALLVFVPAGTLRYPGGLLLMAVLFVPMFVAGLVMMSRAPELLRRRLNAKEEQLVQKGVIALSGLMFVACFVLGGLSFRFQWLTLPWGVQLAAAAAARWRCRRGRSSWTRGCTDWCGTRCTSPRC